MTPSSLLPEPSAAAASISRTTAYRYFPNKRALLLAAHPEIAATSMLPRNPPQDVPERLDVVVRNFSAMILDTEAQQRTMLGLSLEADPAERGALPLRQGRAIGWIAEALEGLEADLSPEQLQTLVLGIRATIGIEALVWLVDVAGMSRTDAVEWHDSTRARVSILSTSSLRDWPVRRFRPNVLHDGSDENRLVGRRIAIGSVVMDVTKRIDRCVMVTRPQPGGHPS